MLVGCDTQRKAWVWSTVTGKLERILEGHNGWVTRAAFRPDGGLLATASLDGTTRIWETRSGRLVRVLGGGLGWFDGVAFAPDGSRLLTGGPGVDVNLWDVRS